jgi:hypothetical protein
LRSWVIIFGRRHTEALQSQFDCARRAFVRAGDGLDALACFVTPPDFLLFFLGPWRERLRVSLPSLGDYRIPFVFFPTINHAQIRSASHAGGITRINGMSHGRQYAAQPFEERAKLIRIRERDRANLLGFLSLGLLPNDETTVFRISNENDHLISTADSDLVSFRNFRHVSLPAGVS